MRCGKTNRAIGIAKACRLSLGWTRHRDEAALAQKRGSSTSQDGLIAELAQRAVVEDAAREGAARLEVFATGPTDAMYVRKRNVAPESDAPPVWSTPGEADVTLTPTSITVRFTPHDPGVLGQRPAGPARIGALNGTWEIVKGYGGLPQTAGEVLFDGHSSSAAPEAPPRSPSRGSSSPVRRGPRTSPFGASASR